MSEGSAYKGLCVIEAGPFLLGALFLETLVAQRCKDRMGKEVARLQKKLDCVRGKGGTPSFFLRNSGTFGCGESNIVPQFLLNSRSAAWCKVISRGLVSSHIEGEVGTQLLGWQGTVTVTWNMLGVGERLKARGWAGSGRR